MPRKEIKRTLRYTFVYSEIEANNVDLSYERGSHLKTFMNLLVENVEPIINSHNIFFSPFRLTLT